MRSARDMRLQSDYDSLKRLAAHSGGTLIVEQTKGRPPDQYVLAYRCRTIERLDKGKPIYRTDSRVEIKLPARYPAPFDAPKVRMLTPVWHPHVYKNMVVCMGDWTTSEYLDAFALRLGALLQFEKEFFNIRDPANEEAVDWARRNLLLFPTDSCTFHDDPPNRAMAASTANTPFLPNSPVSPMNGEMAPTTDRHSSTPITSETILWEELD